MTRRLLAIGAIVAMLGAGSVAAALEPQPRALFGSPDRQVSFHALGSEFAPDIAYNPLTLEYLVVWMDDRDFDTKYFDIWGQRVSSTTGLPIGGPIRISSRRATGTDRNPSVAFSVDDNRYFVVWDDDRSDLGFTWGVYGRFVDGETGAVIGPDVTITPWIQYTEQQHPAVAYNPISGAFVVVWQDGRDLFGRGQDIFMMMIDATTRMKLTGNRRVSTRPLILNEERPAVDVDPVTGDFLVVWQDSAGGSYDIRSRLYDATGKAKGPARPVTSARATGNDRVPQVRYNPSAHALPMSRGADGGSAPPFFVVWEDDRALGSRGTDIFGAMVGADGRRASLDRRISHAFATSNEWNPKLHVDPATGEFLVVFEDKRNSEIFGSDIRARRADATGRAFQGDFTVPADGSADQFWPVVAFGNGAFGVSLLDFRNGPVDLPPDYDVAVSDIFVRLVTP